MKRRHKQRHVKQAELPLEGTKSLFETRGIFSDHYIKTKLKTSPLWPKEETVKPLYEFCLDLWNRLHITLARSNEELTRQEFLEKIIPKLGFAHIRNQPLPATYGRKEPDYLLFGNLKIKESAVPLSKPERYALAISVMEAKKVNHPLDAVSKTETPGRFPHQQIRDYLQEATDIHGKPYFNWAVLTNGNIWRLYCRSARPNDYFEFNLEKSLNSLEDFMIFATLFRAHALTKNSEGKCLLDDLRDEALQFQTKLEDDLRRRVFNILENLANGFYKKSENKITEHDLNDVYQNCLIFLYRLLFVLYAEGRGLLPTKPAYTAGANKNYRERYSLQRFVHHLKSPQEFRSDEFTKLYEDLLELFHLINGDKPSLNKLCEVPLYNGRLFDSKKYPKIEKWRVGEKTLAEVLRDLIFSPVPTRRGEQNVIKFGETIDYADLEIRQLGSIYEGLLENHLELKDSHVQLVADKTERKATGTYYTPDYIVQYIVKNTLEYLCEEIDKSSKVQKAKNETLKNNSYANVVLKLNILDPAMGSGHFLVRATEFLADKILSHPTTALQVDKVPKGLSQEQVEIAYWRRRVVESCIYGVDLNPLAVELAKLSLWLTCISSDQPLNFLDHHLRTGNSLIGAEMAELSELPSKKKTNQLPLSFGPDLPNAIREAIRGIHNIEETESKDIATIKDKESKWYSAVIPQLEPYRTIADLWTSTFFGSTINKDEYPHIAQHLIAKPAPKTKEAKKLKEFLQKYKDTIETVKAKKFFHWELEFPEVFFNEDGSPKENAGFDAIIGNPPYDVLSAKERKENQSELQLELNYYKTKFSCFSGKLNLYRLMSERTYSYLCDKGRFGFIVPNTIMADQSSAPLRRHLFNSSTKVTMLEFPESSKVFYDVTQAVCILVTQKGQPPAKEVNIATGFKNADELLSPQFFNINIKEIAEIDPNLSLPNINNMSIGLFRKLLTFSAVAEIKELSIFQGEVNLTNYGDCIRTVQGDRLIRGEHLSRYKMIFTTDKPSYIDTDKYLVKAGNAKKAQHHRIQRIAFQEVSNMQLHRRLNAALISPNHFLAHTTNYLLVKNRYSIYFILAIINSRLLNWRFKLTSTTNHVSGNEVRRLPLRKIVFSTPSTRRSELLVRAKELHTHFLKEGNTPHKLWGFMDECLGAKPEKGDVAHDFLAFLAEQMVVMNKEKQKLISDFSAWLEKELVQGSIEDFKNKTKIKEFHAKDLDSLVDVLKQNRVLPKMLNLGDERYLKLEKAFNETMTKLNPLIDKISKTDDLIDQIVYKLYGLTDEEIKIVEEFNKAG
jgi:Alw26I/Eco31I/Esp3I family type II restriction m6 adenine DNA methyltransferase